MFSLLLALVNHLCGPTQAQTCTFSVEGLGKQGSPSKVRRGGLLIFFAGTGGGGGGVILAGFRVQDLGVRGLARASPCRGRELELGSYVG